MSRKAPRESSDAIFERFMALAPNERKRAIRGLRSRERREFSERWWLWSLKAQRAPQGEWNVWLIRAGRGFGKTRAGAEWVIQFARDHPDARIALVGATIEDAYRVMIDGASGLMRIARSDEQLEWRAALGELRFPSGARAFVYSAAAPNKLRGPQHEAAWCDELANWPEERGSEAWHNLRMTMRDGEDARIVVTTTPKSVELMRRVRAGKRTHETSGATRDNPWLPRSFVEAMTEEYAGTRLGRQELDGEMLDDVAGALWKRDLIEERRVASAPELVRVVVGVDPPASAGGDACGIVAAGLGRDGCCYVIEDASVAGASPEGWARAVAACAARHGADRVVAEKNQGGEMVESVLRAADAGLPVTLVHASRGKSARAEPVSLLYEAGKAFHAGVFPALEDELCGLQIGGGYEGPGRSPDRADALVWAMTALVEGRGREPRVTVL